MLYVFYVDVGKRLKFDMNLVNESVLELKHAIEENQNIPSNKQVLLVNGGECLQDTAKVCKYAAGTDTNPIYLFNRTFLERGETPCISNVDYKSDNNSDLNQLYERIENFNASNVTIYSINKVNELAQKFLMAAKNTVIFCDNLNSDQLLQQQGWFAAIANLDDVLQNFKCQCEAFDAAYSRYLETRQQNIDLVSRFDEDLRMLSQIPLLPALVEGNEEERARLEMCYDKNQLNSISLADWISAKEPEHSLEHVVEICKAALQKYDEEALISLKEDIKKLFHPDRLKALHDHRDISEKLMTLSGLIVTIKDAFEDQEKKADSISLNHKRATALKDDTILPDLLETHKDTLRSMRANHTNLKSCCQLCIQSKKELCDSIHRRLKAIMMIQEQAAEIRSLLLLQGANMKRMRDYIELIQQLHTTPRKYVTAISEVVRRRSYSQAFLMWASDLAYRIFTIYTEETERRKKFMADFEGHFLNCLFPGLDDMPPSFATQSPPLFDNNLPQLCEDDLHQLCKHIPNLEDSMPLPDINAIRNFFLSKSLTLSDVNIQNDNEANIASSAVDELALVTRVGVEGQSASHSKDENFTQDMIISSDSNFGVSSNENKNENSDKDDKMKYEMELQSMKNGITFLGTVAHKTVVSLRNDLSSLRSWFYCHRSEIMNTVHVLYSHIHEYQNQIQVLLQTMNDKDNKIKALYLQLEEEKLGDYENEKIETRIQEEVQKEKKRAIKEVTEQLNRNHKRELEILRQRFKLMTCTNMERFPSDTSLERIERGDVMDMNTHETIINQLKHDAEIKMRKVLSEERFAYDRKLEEETQKFETEKQILTQTIRTSLTEEFNRQMETMRLRETSLLSELQRHKETIHTLTNPEGGSYSLLSRIEELEREKNRLEIELINERKMKYPFTSVSSNNSLYPTDSGGSSTSLQNNSSPELPQGRVRYKEKIAYKKSRKSSYLFQGQICLQSCNVGDPVLVVWDDQQRNYTILQDSSTLHFLHPNSVDLLGLRPPSDGSPRKLYCPAEVTEKEYCAPKKTINRYNLKEGERFYRVKVKPLKSVIRTV